MDKHLAARLIGTSILIMLTTTTLPKLFAETDMENFQVSTTKSPRASIDFGPGEQIDSAVSQGEPIWSMG